MPVRTWFGSKDLKRIFRVSSFPIHNLASRVVENLPMRNSINSNKSEYSGAMMVPWSYAVKFCLIAVLLIPEAITSPVLTAYESSESQSRELLVLKVASEPTESVDGHLSALTPDHSDTSRQNQIPAPDHPVGSLDAENGREIDQEGIIEDGHEKTTELAPEETSTAKDTSTTTTPPQPLLHYQIQTSSLITQNKDSMNQLQLDMLRYETQLNLNTLDSILPVLETVRRNMSALLDTPHESFVEFEAESVLLQQELLELEDQINGNRAVQQRYSQIESDTRRQLELVQKSLGDILTSQVRILNPEALAKTDNENKTTGDDVTMEEVQDYFKEAQINNYPLDHMLNYFRSVATPGIRIYAYEQFGEIIRVKGRTSPVFLSFIRDIYFYPELEPIRSTIPRTLSEIFNPTPKALEMRRHSRQLGIASIGGAVNTNRNGKSLNKQWIFQEVDDGAFFIILHSRLSQGIGVVDSTTSTPSDRFKKIIAKPLSNILTDEDFHWKIFPVPTGSGADFYLKFVNRGTGLALDANDSDNVYPHSVNDGENQQWELH